MAGERLDRRKMARGEEKEALALEGGEGSESTGSRLVCMYYHFSCLSDVHCLLSVVMNIICESQFLNRNTFILSIFSMFYLLFTFLSISAQHIVMVYHKMANAEEVLTDITIAVNITNNSITHYAVRNV